MSRLSIPTRDSLDASGQQIWDAISGPRKGMHGPYLMLMHVPQLASLIAQLGGHLRFHGLLPGAVRELAILATARTLNVPFEWVMHEPVARQEGIRSDTIETVRAGKFDLLSGRDKLVAAVASAICRDRRLSDSLFAGSIEEFGEKQTTELITLISFYTMIADIITCFEVELPAGAATPF